MNGWLRWWEFRKPAHCPHLALRGISGDAINYRPGYRRMQCRRCGTYLDGPVELSDPKIRAAAITHVDRIGA